ncbi:MAG: response regulator [Acidobacteriaceae bacterium]|nr:response regulator [Acidobacteriaceae bacterium]
MIEDNRADVFLIRDAIQAKFEADIQVIPDGEKAIRMLQRLEGEESAPGPDLVILDINLPKKDGGQVLFHIRNTKRYAATPVIIVTSSDSAVDREEMARQGANAYFRKPSEYAEFMKLGEVAETILAGNSPSNPPN